MKIIIKHLFTQKVLFDGDTSNLRGADLREANLWEANLWGANLREADLWGADLWGANLREADLRKANLWGANLREADLRKANLWGANLWGADLRGADLDFMYLHLKGTRNDLYLIKNKIQIGCEVHTINHWLKNYKKIGEGHGYNPKEIKEYYKYIKMCKEVSK